MGNIDLNTTIEGLSLSKVCTVKPDKDSESSKTVTLNVNFTGATLQSVFDKVMGAVVIQWQGANRKGFDKLIDKSTIRVDFKAPGRTTIDPKQQLIAEAKAAGVDVTNVKALMSFIEKQIETMNQ